tara:strand:+ start:921 stop:1151 length:231 start_codon:yes stop_codon:yes gene_type:complete
MLIEITSFWEAVFWVLYIAWTLALIGFAFFCNEGEENMEDEEECGFDLSDEVFEDEEEGLTLDEQYREYGHTRADF